MVTALIYAYKTKGPEKFGINPNRIDLAYQVDQPLAPYQCDFGKEMTAHMLRDLKGRNGRVIVINGEDGLIIPLCEHKLLVPVPQELLNSWGLIDLLN